MATTYLNKNYQVIVNCFQTAILFLFNQNETLTVSEIEERCQISEADLKQSLLRLCNPKTQVLLKQNLKKPTFEKNEQIKVNPKFENNNLRLNLLP